MGGCIGLDGLGGDDDMVMGSRSTSSEKRIKRSNGYGDNIMLRIGPGCGTSSKTLIQKENPPTPSRKSLDRSS